MKGTLTERVDWSHPWRKPERQSDKGVRLSEGLECLNAEMLSLTQREGNLKNFKLSIDPIRFALL